jgi:photosystem II stability/assembly factor-like uncharacterized protein
MPIVWSKTCKVALAACLATLSGVAPALEPEAATATSPSTWYWQNPLPRDYQLSAIACRSATACLAAKYDGSIATTDDGGQHWTNRRTGLAAGLSYFACPGPAVCYALGIQAPAVPGPSQNVTYVLLRSTDGGATWQAASHFQGNTRQFVNSFGCPSPTTCLAGMWHYGQPQAASILRTADGGKTWQSVQLASIFGISTVDCATSTVCYAVGTDKAGSKLFRSGNSGKTWSAGGLKSPGEQLRIACPGEKTCFGAVSTYACGCSAIFLTTDGAKSWKKVGDNPAYHLLGAVACPSMTTCYVLAASGSNAYHTSIVGSTNGGKTWSIHDLPDTASEIVCPSPTSCFLNAGFAVLTTRDGFGHTRETLSHSVLHNLTLTDISCPGINTCYAASLRHACASNGGECNQVPSPGAATADGGKTWTKTPAPTELSARLKCPSTAVCYSIAGDTGAPQFVERSGDGTRTWKQVFPTGGMGGFLTDISCPVVRTCYVTASAQGPTASPGIFVTRDGGQTWMVQSEIDALFPATAGPGARWALVRVSCSSVTTCFALAASIHQIESNPQVAPQWGATMALLVTSNGGATWTRKSAPDMNAGDSPGLFTPPLACPTVTTCYLLLSNGSAIDPSSTGDILVTHDSGTSWRRTVVQAKANLMDIACSNADACWVAGWSGIFATADGGTTWQRQVMLDGAPLPPLSSIACPAADTCYAVGGPFFTDVTIVGTRARGAIPLSQTRSK